MRTAFAAGSAPALVSCRSSALCGRRVAVATVHATRRYVRARPIVASSSAEGERGRASLSRVRAVAQRMSPIGVFFLIVTYLWSFILFVPMLIAHPFVLAFDGARRRFHDYIAMAWMQFSMGSVFIKYKVTNAGNLLPDGVPVVYVANHASYIDIYSFAYLQRRIKYVSKAEIFRMPVVGWAMQMAGNVALKRMSRRGQMEAYRKMVAVLRNRISLVVFPEGTRSVSGKLRRFQMGAFRAAKAAKVPVVPITIEGTRQMMPADALVPLRYPWDGIELIVHPPIESKDITVEELRDKAFKSIDSGLPRHLQSCAHSDSQYVG